MKKRRHGKIYTKIRNCRRNVKKSDKVLKEENKSTHNQVILRIFWGTMWSQVLD